MTLKTAVGLFAGLLLGLFAALSVSMIRIADLLDRSGRDLAMAAESISLAQELEASLLTHNRDAFLFSLHQDQGRMASRQAQRAEVVALMQTISLLVSEEEEANVLARLRSEIEDYFEQRDRLSDSGLAPTEQYDQISRNVDAAIGVAEQLIRVNRRQMRQLIAEINARNETAEWTAIALLLVGSVILVGLIAAVILFAARPLSRLTAAMERYGAGDGKARAGTAGLDEIREIAHNFNFMADRLEQRQQDQLRFVASIAHDLKNPLHSIGLVSELLAHKSAEQDRELANIVLRQVKSLDHLVQDLLDTSRIEAGQLRLQLTVQDLKETIRDAVALQSRSAELHDFVLHLPSDDLSCRCDGGRVSQVLNNLLSNAVKYSPSGGRIAVKADREADRVRIDVTDQGIGVAPGDQENIFKPFHRTAATKDLIPGIGLGLSASRRIAEAHGGSLTVESMPEKGSTFTLILPCGVS